MKVFSLNTVYIIQYTQYSAIIIINISSPYTGFRYGAVQKRAESSIETKEPVLLDCGGGTMDGSLVARGGRPLVQL